ncbi:MAG: autotransporter-associated beta strand repeat-containing protein, partial [Thermoguttaceae bacterium]
MSQKTHGSNLKYGIGFLTVALCLLTAATLQAATLYWNPTTGGNGTWDTTSTNLMWNSAWASPPAYAWGTFDSPTIDSATFEGGTTGTVTVGSGGISVQNIIVGASTDTVANNYTLSGGPITLTGTSPYIIGITNATDVLTINSTITGTSLYFNNNTGPTWTGGTSATQGVGNLIITSNNSSTLTGGTVYVGGYDQSTATAGCYLRINNSNALGTDAINIGSHNCTANLSLDGTAGSITLANVITLNGRSDGTTPESNLSPQIVNYAGNNSITPAITVTSGGVDYIIESDAGTLTLTGGISNTDRTGHRELVLQGNGNIVMSGPITGLASPASTDNFIVVKAGSGTVTLASSNSYSGDTAVNGGALRLQNSNALGSVAFAHTVTIAGGTATSRIELDGSTAPLSIARTITLAGRNAPSAIHLLNVAGNNSISGDISLATSGDQYVIQSDAATLTLNTITNNTASTTPRYLYLQGGGNGQVGGIIGDASGTTGALNVTKSGTGTWTLSAANTYTGATTINGGTFSLGTTGSISSSSPAINVSSGAYFDVSGLAAAFTIGSGSTAQALAGSGTVLGSAANGIINGSNGIISPGGDGTAGTLSIQNKLALGSSLTSTVKFDLASNNTPANNDLLSVAGDLSIPGPSTFAFSMLNGQLASATYKLISYTGSLTGGAASIAVTGLGSGTTRQIFTLSSAIAHEIDLVVTGTPANLTWKGNLNSNAWDLKSTLNWNNNAEMFYNLDLLTFDGSASSSSNINVTAAVQPGSMTFNNTAAKDYTITGIGAIGGAGGMTLNNGGKVIVANTAANSYSGAIQINSGTLQIGDGGADGSIGTGAITNNGTLVFNQSSNYATAATNVISGAGSLQKQGTGALTLNGNSPSFTGSVAISAGTIVMGSANALGPTSATSAITISNNAALDVNGNTLGARPVSVQGAGPDGTSGAIVSSATADQINAFQYVTLTGNTTFGGTGRWDIRSNSGGSLTGAGYNLTKVGTNMISLTGLGETGLGNIDVKNGTLQIETTTTLGDTTKTITVESNGVLAMYNLGTNILNKNLTLQGGTLGTSFGTAGTTNNFSGAVTLVGGGNLSPAVDTSGTSGFTVSGSIGGTGMLTKTGTAGTVILTGTANAWNGGTTINGGTLQIGTGVANGSLPDVVGTTITNNGTLFINSTNNTNLLNTTITTTATAGTGIGYLTVNGTGLVILGQTNSYTGNTQVGVDDGVNGYLRIAASGALGTGTLTVAGGSNTGTFSLDGASAPGGGITITNAINLDGRRDNQNLALAPHILNVSGNNTIGAISCGVWGNQYLFQSDAGKLTIGSITNNTGNATARIIYLRGAGDGEITGSIQNGTGTGPQSVIKDGSGTWTLLGGNGYTGNTTIMQGTLAIGPSGYLSSTVTQVMAGATFDVRNAASYILFGGQTLSGGGTVIGDFNDTALAIFSPGDTSGAGTLTFNDSSNTLTLAGSDYINYNISGATADLLDVKGNMTLSG